MLLLFPVFCFLSLLFYFLPFCSYPVFVSPSPEIKIETNSGRDKKKKYGKKRNKIVDKTFAKKEKGIR